MTMSAPQPTDREIAERAAREIVWDTAYPGPVGCSKFYAAMWEKASDEIERALSNARADAERETVERCAQAAEAAVLPPDFHWGHGEMSRFTFGKNRAAKAIRALSPPSPKDQPE